MKKAYSYYKSEDLALLGLAVSGGQLFRFQGRNQFRTPTATGINSVLQRQDNGNP